MKKLLVLFLLTLSLSGFYVADNMHLPVVQTVADLKLKAVSPYTPVFVLARNDLSDGLGLGAIYYWKPDATDAEDMTFLNVIGSSVSATGRWMRLIVRTQQLPGGILVSNSGKKEYFTSIVTSAQGKATINLTADGTATGTALFSTIYSNRCEMVGPMPTSINNAILEYTESVSSDKKQTTHQFYKGNSTAVGALGLSVVSFTAAPASVSANCTIAGF
ncbi:hypothetical protein [Spirosoma oryzicola]|uniref:hypothetical protein n=1 Tax=Spirosoma oryzicola TaxID=2898794 RepID=UPI001E3C21AF|nr:hypothetical protein [Spirosoma oryzicola]UHG93236.1 hypothetical protein LQ777_10125 [Spirosoma oryzicola]